MERPGRRVLLLAGRLTPSEVEALRSLLERLEGCGISARVACVSGWLGPGGVNCPSLGSRWRCPRAGRAILGTDPDGRPELIHALGMATAGAALTLADGWGIPYLLTVDGFLATGGRLRLAKRWCQGLVVGCPELAVDLVTGLGVPVSWVEVIPPALTLPERASSLRPGPVRVVGVAAGLRTGSGLSTFLGAAKRVVATGLDVEFVLAGLARDEADLRRRAERLGLAGRVTFADDPGPRGFFWEVLDVYCQPSEVADPGRTLATAMGHGLPCVATDVPGLRSLTESGALARLVPSGNAEALATAILALLADGELARELGRRGRASVMERFNPVRGAEALTNRYSRCWVGAESERFASPGRIGDDGPASVSMSKTPNGSAAGSRATRTRHSS